MAKFGKWIGGGLGWTFGGPIGAIFGFVIGAVSGVLPALQASKLKPTEALRYE